MTLNISVASPKLLICASDRRLTDPRTGKPTTERSTKLTALWCADALVLIAYNGIGSFHGETPSDWLQGLSNKNNLASLHFKEVLQNIREEANLKISEIRLKYPKCDFRHTFVLGAWGRGQTWLCAISNYENACNDETGDKAQDVFTISCLPQLPGTETRVLVTGATQDVSHQDIKRILSVAKKRGASGFDIKNICVKAIQNAANRRSRKGTIGTSVLWAVAERFKGVHGGLDVLGGTSVDELPNIIGSSIQMKDIRVESASRDPVSWGKPFPLPEEKCPKCKNPVPLGYLQCGICGEPLLKK